MNQEEHIMLIVKLSLKLQCNNLVYAIIQTHIFWLKELLQSKEQELMQQLDKQMKEIKV